MIVGIIALLSLGVRLLMGYDFDKSALLYIGIPFIVSLLLIQFRDPEEAMNWKKRYRNRLIDAFIIMFASSVVLFEGFVCVVMFMPIYLLVITIMFLIELYRERAKKKGRGILSVNILPVLILLSAFEGTSPQLSYDRNEQVIVSRVVQSSIANIKNNLVQPISLDKTRPWFLELFPMPTKVISETLSPGDVHEIHFKYYRWFFTNVHEGRMLLEMTEVDENRIKTTFLDDTSYIANYIHLKGTEIQLEKIDNQYTRITLTINFKRILDPYWYFSPIERYGITKTASFLITEIIARDAS